METHLSGDGPPMLQGVTTVLHSARLLQLYRLKYIMAGTELNGCRNKKGSILLKIGFSCVSNMFRC